MGYKAKDAAAFVKELRISMVRPLPCGKLTSLGDHGPNMNAISSRSRRTHGSIQEIADEETRP